MAQAVNEQGHHPAGLGDVAVARGGREAQAGEQQLAGVHVAADGAGRRGGVEQAAQRRRELAEDVVRKIGRASCRERV